MLIDCHNHLGADLLFYLHGDFPYSQQLVADDSRRAGRSASRTGSRFPFVSYAAMDVTKFRTGGIAL
jgi:hypothetical protein